MHESSEEFEIRRDLTTDCRVSCPLASEKTLILTRIMGKNDGATFSRLCLVGSFSYLLVTMTYIRALMSSKFGQTRLRTTELAALERLKVDGATFSRLFFVRSFSYLQVTITCRRACRSLKFGQIRPPTAELAALERLKKFP